DLVDLALTVLAHPQAALGPGQARIRALPRRGNARKHLAAGRVDAVDARLGDLVEEAAIEGRAGVARTFDGAHRLAAGRVDGDDARTERGPHVLPVVAHAVHGGGAIEGTVLAHDLCALEGWIA